MILDLHGPPKRSGIPGNSSLAGVIRVKAWQGEIIPGQTYFQSTNLSIYAPTKITDGSDISGRF